MKKSYDRVYGKILLEVKSNRNETSYMYNGKYHRNDGKPAIVYKSGAKKWFVNGQLHREDGPALEWVNSAHEYWLHSCELTKDEWEHLLTLTTKERLKYLNIEHYIK